MSEQSTILIIDDSIDIHRLLKLRLKNQEVDIISTMGGKEGLTAAQDKQPDLILLDIHMPDMNGFEVLAELKDNPATVELPVIFLSGSDDSKDIIRGFDLGAVDYVTKPFDVAELRARVRSALRTRRLMAMLAQRAQIDGLTGLWNRAHLDEQLTAFLSASDRHGHDLSLLLCDIDHFKKLNDTCGHPFGDHVLQRFAKLLMSEARESDIPCRYGGEEFAIILPNITLPDALQVAERIRSHLESMTWKEHNDLRVTASFGVTDIGCLEGKPFAPQTMIDSVDQALYKAKHNGRNQVVTAAMYPLPKSA